MMNVRTIAAMLSLAASLMAAGGTARADSAVTWGRNNAGQLGNNNITVPYGYTRVPVAVSGMSEGVTAVAGGSSFSLSVQNGGVWGWGNNFYGQLGDTGTTRRLVPVAAVGLSSGVTAIAAGDGTSLAIKDGGVWAWGYVANSHVPAAVSELATGVTAISAGDSFCLAIKEGTAYAWGYNGAGQLGNNSTAASHVPVVVNCLAGGVTAIDAAAQFGLAVKDGGVWSWGNNQYGRLGHTGTTNSLVPLAVSELSSGVTAVAAGDEHCLALKDGGVWAWGLNNEGQLGNNSTTSSYVPVQVDPAQLHDIVAIAAGWCTSYALSADGSLWVWGYNYTGELGLGSSTTSFTTPQHLPPPEGYVFTSIDAAAGGGNHAIATLSVVPEPASLSLLALAGTLLLRRRRHVGCGPARTGR